MIRLRRRALLPLASALFLPLPAKAEEEVGFNNPCCEIDWQYSPPTTVDGLIIEAATRHGVNLERMRYAARKESQMGNDLNAYSSRNPYRGVFQFSRLTWEEQAPLHGIPWHFDYAWNNFLNVELAAFLMRKGQWFRWGMS